MAPPAGRPPDGEMLAKFWINRSHALKHPRVEPPAGRPPDDEMLANFWIDRSRASYSRCKQPEDAPSDCRSRNLQKKESCTWELRFCNDEKDEFAITPQVSSDSESGPPGLCKSRDLYVH